MIVGAGGNTIRARESEDGFTSVKTVVAAKKPSPMQSDALDQQTGNREMRIRNEP